MKIKTQQNAITHYVKNVGVKKTKMKKIKKQDKKIPDIKIERILFEKDGYLIGLDVVDKNTNRKYFLKTVSSH